MFLIFWLRIINDLAFYYAFAGLLVSLSGSALCSVGLLLPSFFCALAQVIRKRRPKEERLNILLSVFPLFCLILPGLSLWDRAALIPVLSYTGYLTLTGRIELTRENRKEIFHLFCLIYPIFFLAVCLFGGFENLLRFSVPYALLTMILCVCLMRLLRHDREVYSRPAFLLGSLLPPAVLMLLGRLLSLPVVLDAVRTALLSVYSDILVPILQVILYGCAYVISGLISPLLSLFRADSDSEGLTIAENGDALSTLGEDSGAPALPMLLSALKILGMLFLIFLSVCLLFRLFRRLAGRSETNETGSTAEEIRHTPAHGASPAGSRLPRSPMHPVNRVRREYRSYLRLCRQNGLNPPCFYTTQDIEDVSRDFFRDRGSAAQLRQLYLQARYHGRADAEDAALAAELVRQLSKEMRRTSHPDHIQHG